MLAYLERTDVKPLDLEGFITAWKDSLTLRVQAGEVKQDTASSYARGLSKFLAWRGERETSPDAIREWKADLLRESHKPASVNAWLAGLRSFFGWLAERGRSNSIPPRRSPAQNAKGRGRNIPASVSPTGRSSACYPCRTETRPKARGIMPWLASCFTRRRAGSSYTAPISKI